MRRKHFQMLSGILLLALLAGPLATKYSVLTVFAQEVTGGIKGIVKDQSGAVVAGANITATNSQRSYKSTTDQDGVYSFTSLPPGVYRVSAGAPGFGTTEIDNIAVELGRTLQVNLDLKVSMVGEVVEITDSDQPIVDVSSSKTTFNITDQRIAVLPNDLNLASVIVAAPSARQETKAGGIQVDGASGSENAFIVDGIEVTNIVGGTLSANKNIPLDFVKEVQIKSAGYEAEFGGATGGVINVVTKSGNNQYHGEARLDFTSDELLGRDGSSYRIDPFDPKQQRVELFKDPRGKPEFRFFNPTVSISGPIIKNRAWFFLSYSPQFNRAINKIELIKPVEPGESSIQVLNTRLIPFYSKTDYTLARIDLSPTKKLSVYGNFINSPSKTEGGGAPGQTTSLTAFEDLRYRFKGGYTPASQAAFGAIWTATPNLIISFRGGYNYFNNKPNTYDVAVNAPLVVISTPCLFRECAPGTTFTGNPTIQNNTTVLFDITRRTNLSFDATYITRIFGRQHVFKGGYQISKLNNKVNSGSSGGEFQFYFDRSLNDQRGKYGYYIVIDRARIGSVSSDSQGIFLQDTWSIYPRVALNLGLRMEKEFVPSFPILPEFHPSIPPDVIKNTTSRPIDFGFGDKLAPRIGAAWDLLGNGKLKLSGSFSFFFDTFKYDLPRTSFGAEKVLRTFRKLEQPDFRGITLQNQPGDIILGPIDFRIPSNVTLPGQRPSVDPNLKPFRTREYSAAVDYAISRDLVLSAHFTRKEIDSAVEDIGGVDAKGNEVFTIGNPGFGVSADPKFFNPPTPKAVRNYTALELRLDKRFSNNWYANISYTLSKLFGNYSGLANSDEGGRINPNVNRVFDLPELSYDSRGRLANGPLVTDRPNTFRAYGAYRFNYRLKGKSLMTEVGGAQSIFQGTPLSTIVGSNVTGGGVSIIANGRGDLGRTPVFTQTDLVVNQFFNIGEKARVKFSLNVFNLFNERNVIDVNTGLLGAGQSVSYKSLNDFLTSNGDYMKRIQEQNLVLNPLFGLPSGYQATRNARLSLGIQF